MRSLATVLALITFPLACLAQDRCYRVAIGRSISTRMQLAGEF